MFFECTICILVLLCNPILNKYILHYMTIKYLIGLIAFIFYASIFATSFIYFVFVLFYVWMVGYTDLWEEIIFLHKKKDTFLFVCILFLLAMIIGLYFFQV
jgi:hypothetical protein